MQRILIITAMPPNPLFEMAVKDLSADPERHRIDIFCPNVFAKAFAQDRRISATLSGHWKSGRFCHGDITRTLIQQLRSRCYERIAILYQDDFGLDAGPLRRLAFSLSGGPVRVLNPKGAWSRLGAEHRLRRFLLPRKWFYYCVNALICIELVTTTASMRAVHYCGKRLRRYRRVEKPI